VYKLLKKKARARNGAYSSCVRGSQMFHLFLSRCFILGYVNSRPFLAPVRIAACLHEVTPELKNNFVIKEIKVRGLMKC